MNFNTPYKDLLPPLQTKELEALKADIEVDGVLVPIIVDEDGNILDGHHRYQIEPNAPYIVRDGMTESEKVAFVLGNNMKRRNLSPNQKDDLRNKQIEIAKKLNEEGRTQAQIGQMLGVTQQAVGKWFSNNTTGSNTTTKDARVKIPKEADEEIQKRAEEGEPQKQIAADFGVTQKTISDRLKKIEKEQKRKKEIEELEKAIEEIPEDVDTLYDVIVIDPPWPYGTKYDAAGRRAASPYPEMSLEEIKAIELPAQDDCVLWLWTTHKFMRHSFEILDEWGFRDVAILTWVKDRMGLGQWLRSQSEFCIMAVKGKPIIDLTNQTTVIHGAMREHSRKPNEFYEMVDKLCVGRKKDWFSREQREGWSQYGNEPERFQ